jgi:hypothetical protein
MDYKEAEGVKHCPLSLMRLLKKVYGDPRLYTDKEWYFEM